MQQIPNSFTSYELTEKEILAGQTLTSLNIAVLQNQLSQLAEERLNLKFTPNDVASFTQQEAYLTGQMDNIKFILASHDAAQSQLKEM